MILGLSNPVNITVISRRATSLVLQYTPRKNHGVHIGYNISYTAQQILQLEKISMVNMTLQDGLIFTISSLLPYSVHNITILPLELQSDALTPVHLVNQNTSQGGNVIRFI